MSDHWVMGDIQARFLQICWVGFGQGQRPRGGGGQNLKSLSHMAAKVPGAPPPMKNFLPTENKNDNFAISLSRKQVPLQISCPFTILYDCGSVKYI